jgi:hypothetical protein
VASFAGQTRKLVRRFTKRSESLSGVGASHFRGNEITRRRLEVIDVQQVQQEPRWTARRIVAVGAIGGALAGMMMGMTEMFYGWVSAAHTFWDPLMAIWAWVGGRSHFGTPSNHIGPIILGLGGHMMNAMVFGMMFAAIAAGMATYLRRRGAASGSIDLAGLMLGLAWGLGAWAIMRYGILPLRAPAEADLFTKALVSPQWTWWLAHAILGMTAGMVFVVARRIGSRRPAQPLERPREFPQAA